MILYILRKNTNPKSAAYGKYFAYPVIEETVNLDGLAEHMSNHNTPYSKGAIKGMLTDMVGCIKELLLEGKNVKIADLAIFSLGIKNNGGAASEEAFSVSKNIRGVKLRARATGELIAKNLNLEATLKKASATSKSVSGEGTTPTGGGTSPGGGTLTGSGTSTNGGSSTGGSSTGGTSTGGGSSTGGNSGSQSGSGSDAGSQNGPGDYRLVIFKYGSGTMTVTDQNGQELNSNDNVASGTTVSISVVPAEGKVPTANYNGQNTIALTEHDGVYTGSFQMPERGTSLEINSEPSDNGYGF
ncbi:MAG: hypothetical protein II822_00950 [Prevotella sp.]|nr:hypothetical protein [Prevotella sp.]